MSDDHIKTVINKDFLNTHQETLQSFGYEAGSLNYAVLKAFEAKIDLLQSLDEKPISHFESLPRMNTPERQEKLYQALVKDVEAYQAKKKALDAELSKDQGALKFTQFSHYETKKILKITDEVLPALDDFFHSVLKRAKKWRSFRELFKGSAWWDAEKRHRFDLETAIKEKQKELVACRETLAKEMYLRLQRIKENYDFDADDLIHSVLLADRRAEEASWIADLAFSQERFQKFHAYIDQFASESIKSQFELLSWREKRGVVEEGGKSTYKPALYHKDPRTGAWSIGEVAYTTPPKKPSWFFWNRGKNALYSVFRQHTHEVVALKLMWDVVNQAGNLEQDPFVAADDIASLFSQSRQLLQQTAIVSKIAGAIAAAQKKLGGWLGVFFKHSRGILEDYATGYVNPVRDRLQDRMNSVIKNIHEQLQENPNHSDFSAILDCCRRSKDEFPKLVAIRGLEGQLLHLLIQKLAAGDIATLRYRYTESGELIGKYWDPEELAAYMAPLEAVASDEMREAIQIIKNIVSGQPNSSDEEISRLFDDSRKKLKEFERDNFRNGFSIGFLFETLLLPLVQSTTDRRFVLLQGERRRLVGASEPVSVSLDERATYLEDGISRSVLPAAENFSEVLTSLLNNKTRRVISDGKINVNKKEYTFENFAILIKKQLGPEDLAQKLKSYLEDYAGKEEILWPFISNMPSDIVKGYVRKRLEYLLEKDKYAEVLGSACLKDGKAWVTDPRDSVFFSQFNELATLTQITGGDFSIENMLNITKILALFASESSQGAWMNRVICAVAKQLKQTDSETLELETLNALSEQLPRSNEENILHTVRAFALSIETSVFSSGLHDQFCALLSDHEYLLVNYYRALIERVLTDPQFADAHGEVLVAQTSKNVKQFNVFNMFAQGDEHFERFLNQNLDPTVEEKLNDTQRKCLSALLLRVADCQGDKIVERNESNIAALGEELRVEDSQADSARAAETVVHGLEKEPQTPPPAPKKPKPGRLDSDPLNESVDAWQAAAEHQQKLAILSKIKEEIFDREKEKFEWGAAVTQIMKHHCSLNESGFTSLEGVSLEEEAIPQSNGAEQKRQIVLTVGTEEFIFSCDKAKFSEDLMHYLAKLYRLYAIEWEKKHFSQSGQADDSERLQLLEGLLSTLVRFVANNTMQKKSVSKKFWSSNDDLVPKIAGRMIDPNDKDKRYKPGLLLEQVKILEAWIDKAKVNAQTSKDIKPVDVSKLNSAFCWLFQNNLVSSEWRNRILEKIVPGCQHYDLIDSEQEVGVRNDLSYDQFDSKVLPSSVLQSLLTLLLFEQDGPIRVGHQKAAFKNVNNYFCEIKAQAKKEKQNGRNRAVSGEGGSAAEALVSQGAFAGGHRTRQSGKGGKSVTFAQLGAGSSS